MDLKKRDELKVLCGQYMAADGLTLKTKTGRAFVAAFWGGAMCALSSYPAFVRICLMSGRYEDLVTFP